MEDLPEQALQLMKAAAPPGSNTADIDYMTSLWEGIHEFSNTMIKATKKYKKDITRKRKAPPSSKDEDSAITPPRKKPKISSSKSPKRPKPSLSTKRASNKKKKVSNKPASPRKKQSASPRKKPIAKTKPSGIKSDRIYRIRRPRTSWVLFNAQKIASLLKEHPKLTLGERTKLSSKEWHALNDEDREEWTEKAEKEKLEFERITKAFESHHDFEQIPTHWKQIDKKAEKERREKQGEKEKNKEISSPKKKKKQIKKSSPKKKKKIKKKLVENKGINTKKKKMIKKKNIKKIAKKKRKESDSDSDSDSDSSLSSDDTSFSGISSSDSESGSDSDSDIDISTTKKKKITSKKNKPTKKLPTKKGTTTNNNSSKATTTTTTKSIQYTSKANVVTRKQAKSIPGYKHTPPLTSSRRKTEGKGNENETGKKGGNKNNSKSPSDLVEKTGNKSRMDEDSQIDESMKELSPSSRAMLLQSQPQDVASEGDDDDDDDGDDNDNDGDDESEMSSIEGLNGIGMGIIARTPDKIPDENHNKMYQELNNNDDDTKMKKKGNDNDSDDDGSSSDDEDDKHFGV